MLFAVPAGRKRKFRCSKTCMQTDTSWHRDVCRVAVGFKHDFPTSQDMGKANIMFPMPEGTTTGGVRGQKLKLGWRRQLYRRSSAHVKSKLRESVFVAFVSVTKAYTCSCFSAFLLVGMLKNAKDYTCACQLVEQHA